jgi:hypothetical protein
MEKIFEQIERFKVRYPEIDEALRIFEIGLIEYQQAFEFLNSPEIITSNTTNEIPPTTD